MNVAEAFCRVRPVISHTPMEQKAKFTTPGGSLTTAKNPNSPPIVIVEKYDLTGVQVHCDFDFSRRQLEDVNVRLHAEGFPSIQKRSRRVRWASQSDVGDYWDFYIESQTLGDDEESGPSVHFVLEASKPRMDVPIPYRRSRRVLNRAGTLIGALAQQSSAQQFDCQVTWHPAPDASFFSDVLPVGNAFPEGSVIEEISGVIGGSTDRTTKFMVDRVGSDPPLYHVWAAFPRLLTINPEILVEAASFGSSLLDDINVWEN